MYSYRDAQTESALDLFEQLAPDADAQQAQEFVRAFARGSDWRDVPEYRYNSQDAYSEGYSG